MSDVIIHNIMSDVIVDFMYNDSTVTACMY